MKKFALLGLLSFLVSCSASEIGPLGIGSPAPEFSLLALDGRRLDLESFAGKVVVLNFWATWCQPCRREIPELVALAESGTAEVVGIALDEEGARAVRPFVERHGIPYTVLIGDQEIFQRFHGFAIPYTLVLDPGRRIVGIYRGPTSRAAIEQALAELSGPGRAANGRAAS